MGGQSHPMGLLLGRPIERARSDRASNGAPTCSPAHGQTTWDYPFPLLAMEACDLRFANRLQTTHADPLAIAVGGWQANGCLSFKPGAFGAIEPLKAAQCALWDKSKKTKS